MQLIRKGNLHSSANSTKAKRRCECGSPHTRQSTTFKQITPKSNKISYMEQSDAKPKSWVKWKRILGVALRSLVPIPI